MKFIWIVAISLAFIGCATPEERKQFQALQECRDYAADFKSEQICEGKECPTHPATTRLKIRYPENALRDWTEGCAFVLYDVRKDGLADNFRIHKIVPEGRDFKEAVLEGLMKQEFDKGLDIKNRSLLVLFKIRR